MRRLIPTMYSYKMEENFEPNIIIEPCNLNVIIEKIPRRIIDSLFLLARDNVSFVLCSFFIFSN